MPDDRPKQPGPPSREVLNLGDEIAERIVELPSALVSEFIGLVARAWDSTPNLVWSLRGISNLIGFEQDKREFVSASIAHQSAFHHLFALMGHSKLLAGWLSRGVWRSVLLDPVSDFSHPALRSRLLPKDLVLSEVSRDAMIAHFQRSHAGMIAAIALGDILGGDDLETVTQRISAVADASIDAAHSHAIAVMESKHGRLRRADGEQIELCVLALGKLGGQELNYSSDIDLLFVSGGEGKSDGSRPLDGVSYCQRVVEHMIRVLSDPGPLGPAYRVDTRLRPDGKAGPLVRSIASALAYYRERGETWERQALLKLRPVAGDLVLGEKLVGELQSFVHRRYLSSRAINEIKALKRRIENRTEARDETYRDVKTGFGGIRDIEFVVQFLQLVNGGRMPTLRTGNTLDALRKLASAGCLQESEAEDLTRAYRLLRRIEHGLQLESGEQTHRVPDRPDALAALAVRLGYQDRSQSAAKQMYLDLARSTVRTRGLLLRLFTGLFTAEPSSPGVPDIALDPEMDHERATEFLAPFGLVDAEAVCAVVRRLATEPPAFRRFEPRTRTYLASALPAMLEFASKQRNPMQTLSGLERFVACLGAKGVFYELLAERPGVLNEVGRLAAAGGWLLELVERRPGLIDPWLDGLRTASTIDESGIRDLLRGAGSSMKPADALRWVRDTVVLQVASADLSGQLTPPAPWKKLASMAGLLVEESFRIAFGTLEDVSVVALGKLGAGALDYGSDLDLIVVTADDPQRRHELERACATAIKLLQQEAQAFEIDMRLRPQGRSGSLTSGLSAFRGYLEQEAAFWERIALTRARVVVGTGSLKQGVEQAIDDSLYQRPLPTDAAQQAKAMRQRQMKEAGERSIKRGLGGLADSDFGLALCQLVAGRVNRSLRAPDVFEAFAALKQAVPELATHLNSLESSMVAQRVWTQRHKLATGTTPTDLPENPELIAARSAKSPIASTSGSFRAVRRQGPEWDSEVESLTKLRTDASQAFHAVLSWVDETLGKH